MTNTLSRLQTPVLAALVAIGGLVAIVFFGPTRVFEASASEGWPSVQGEVVRTGLSSSHSRSSGTTWSVGIDYRYEVDGAVQDGDRWSVNGDPDFADRTGAERFAAELPAGKAIAVYYNPEDATQAVLRPGGSGKAWANLSMGVLFFLVGVGLLIRWLAQRG